MVEEEATKPENSVLRSRRLQMVSMWHHLGKMKTGVYWAIRTSLETARSFSRTVGDVGTLKFWEERASETKTRTRTISDKLDCAGNARTVTRSR